MSWMNSLSCFKEYEEMIEFFEPKTDGMDIELLLVPVADLFCLVWKVLPALRLLFLSKEVFTGEPTKLLKFVKTWLPKSTDPNLSSERMIF